MEKWVDILEEVEKQSSSKEKIQLLEIGLNTYPELETFLKMAFNSVKILNIDAKTIENSLSINTKQNFVDIGEKLKWYLNNGAKNKSLLDIGKKQYKTFKDFVELYNKLSENRGILVKTLLNNFFLNCDENDAKWYVRCLCKDLHSGFNIRTLNKVLVRCDKKIITKFSMQLALKIEYTKRKEQIESLLEENNRELYIEAKYNGVRLGLRNTNPLNPGVWEAISRNEKPILNVNNLLYEANRIFGDTPTEIEGELIADEFENLMTTIKRKNDLNTIIPRTLKVFDITYYKKDITNLNYLDRRSLLLKVLDKKSDIIDISDMIICHDVKTILAFFKKCIENKLEGIVIKTNTPYQRKRIEWKKLKPTDTLDLKIIGFNYATKGKHSGMRNSIIVSSDDGLLQSSVGSGLKHSDIELFSMGEESDWIGKIIEVKFDMFTPKNKDGIISLRDPRFVKLRDDKDVADIV